MEFNIGADSTNGNVVSASIRGGGTVTFVDDATYNVSTGTWYPVSLVGAGLGDVKGYSYYQGAL